MTNKILFLSVFVSRIVTAALLSLVSAANRFSHDQAPVVPALWKGLRTDLHDEDPPYRVHVMYSI